MNLRETILEEHSKAQKDKIVNWVGNSQKRFDALFKLFLNDEYRVVQRAAYPLSYCVQAHPEFIKPHWKKLLANLSKKGIHDAVKRNTLRLMEDVEIPEAFHGDVMNICFGYVSSNEESIAVRTFSLTVLDNLSKKYPDIRNELKLIIEERWPHETAAFHARARKILKKL